MKSLVTMGSLASLLAACAGLAGCQTSKPAGSDRKVSSTLPIPPSTPIVESEQQHDARMSWWRDARFGMFVHWGIYAVPAGRWPGYDSKNIGEWIQRNAKVPVYEYEKFSEQFNPVDYDPQAWVSMAKDAGCKYIVITSKHHDGFSMFDSAYSRYDIVDATPYGKDPMRALAAETRRQGLQMCFYYSIWDWHNADFRKDRMPIYSWFMKNQLRELVQLYGPLGVLWFDGEWPDEWTEEMGQDLYNYVRGLQPSIIVNNRVGKARDDMAGISKYKGAGDYDTPEQEVPSKGLPGVDWETCMTMNDTWGYKLDDHNWKSSTQLVRTLVEVVSKGGNFLLNVGPDAKGRIPAESVKLMGEIGKWMRINDAAIYGTTASPFDRSPWGRATQKTVDGKRLLYLHVFDWPADGTLRIPGLKSKPKAARVLGSSTPVTSWRTEGSDLVLSVQKTPVHPAATVVELTLDGPPDVEQLAQAYHKQNADGKIELLAADADLPGRSPRIESRENIPSLGFWTDASGVARWYVDVAKPGAFDAALQLACKDESAGDVFKLTVTGPDGTAAVLSGPVPATGDWGNFTSMSLGQMTLGTTGKYVVELKPATDKLKNALMNLRRIDLVPTSSSK